MFGRRTRLKRVAGIAAAVVLSGLLAGAPAQAAAGAPTAQGGGGISLAGRDWKNVAHMVSANFSADSFGERPDLFVVWKDGSASLFEGGGPSAAAPFVAEHKIAEAGSVWQYARAITGGVVTHVGKSGFGSTGLVVRWSDGELTEYQQLDHKGVHGEKTLAPGGGDNPVFKKARLMTLGGFVDESSDLNNDLLVLWEDGSTSLYPYIDYQGLSGRIQLTQANDAWKNAAQISSGRFSGKKTDDLLIRWKDGDTSLFPGVDDKGFHGRVRIQPTGSSWKSAQALVTGLYGSSMTDRYNNDILVNWPDGRLVLYPRVDDKGIHGEVQLAG
ncbi:hypothetical protein ACFP1Z_03960 [Streptomyces gamaensis]|uniref:Uncharacterized protein n=1 Tax=Streptomyces gamaensis TaxID=1763542 RepID=A0ABW0YV15_9ACTN